MDHQQRSPSSPNAAFAHLTQTYAQVAQQYADALVRRSRFLSSPDQDDIYAQGMAKIWHAYFRQEAQQCYEYRDPLAEFRLIKMALRSVANDLIAQRRRETMNFRPVELDALQTENIAHRGLSQADDFAAAVATKLALEQFIHQQGPGSTLWWVALYLSGNASRAQSAPYTDGNLRTSETRLRQRFKAFLCE